MFKTILWATDGSANADRALPIVKDLAEGKTAKLLVAHCRELLAGRAAGLPVNADENELLVKIRRQAAELEADGFDVRLDVVTATGTNAAHALADLAREHEAEVIVVGTRGHSPVVGALLGSVTQHLLHLAPCPVLAVPSGGHVESAEHAFATTTAG